MQPTELLKLIDHLAGGIHPVTLKPFDLEASCLKNDRISNALSQFRGLVVATIEAPGDVLTDTTLEMTCRELISLGYKPSCEQVAKVLRASRSIADASLKAVTAYGLYRNKLGKRALMQVIKDFASNNQELFPNETFKPVRKKKEKPAHLQNPFFRENSFDKLSEEKMEELRKEVKALGFTKATDKLPEYMQKARNNYPRAYEPWSRAEQALLIEAMCYTNDASKIAGIFGRTANSVSNTGLKLIYESQRRGQPA